MSEHFMTILVSRYSNAGVYFIDTQHTITAMELT